MSELYITVAAVLTVLIGGTGMDVVSRRKDKKRANKLNDDSDKTLFI